VLARPVVDWAPELPMMKDGGYEARAKARKTSTVESGAEDGRGGVEGGG
jgi:hypothetical protein